MAGLNPWKSSHSLGLLCLELLEVLPEQELRCCCTRLPVVAGLACVQSKIILNLLETYMVIAGRYLDSFDEGKVVFYQSLFQNFSLFWCYTRVQSGQLPQGDDLVTQAGTCVLWCLAVGIDVVLPMVLLLQCHFGIEPPNDDLQTKNENVFSLCIRCHITCSISRHCWVMISNRGMLFRSLRRYISLTIDKRFHIPSGSRPRKGRRNDTHSNAEGGAVLERQLTSLENVE